MNYSIFLCYRFPVFVSEFSFHEHTFQTFCIHMGQILIIIGSSNSSCLLTYHYGQSIGFLADASGGTVAQAKFLGDVQVVADGQDAGRGRYLSAGYYHGSVVKGRVLEEYVFYEALGNLCLYTLAGADKVAQRQVVLHHYECTGLLLAHVQASHQYGHYGFAVIAVVFLKSVGGLRSEETPQAVHPLMGAYGVEEMADFLLEKDNDGYGTHTNQLVL